MSRGIRQRVFGTLDDGSQIMLFTLSNAHGMRIAISDLGAAIVSIHCPDRHGRLADVVLGFDTPQDYLSGSPYVGTVVGRYCNRIAHGRFILDGRTCQLATNDNGHQLHGGPVGFDKRRWQAGLTDHGGSPALQLKLTSPDGDQGFPGTVEVTASYSLSDANQLYIDFRAVCDRPTHVNLTQHCYYNLAGTGDILGHHLSIDADRYLPVDATLIPLGHLQSVAGSAFDFRFGKSIGAHIEDRDDQLDRAHGYDHNFVLNDAATSAKIPAAWVFEPTSGRVLEVFTTAPGLQFYSGNFLDGTFSGKGRVLSHRSGFCLEPQLFPDSPNQPAFPTTELRPGEIYRSATLLRFSAA